MKNKIKPKQGPVAANPEPVLTPTQWQGIGAGLIILTLGFLALSRSNASGDNWAALIAPFLILGGYGAIGLALWPAPPPGKE